MKCHFETKTETIANILKYCEPETKVGILLVIASVTSQQCV